MTPDKEEARARFMENRANRYVIVGTAIFCGINAILVASGVLYPGSASERWRTTVLFTGIGLLLASMLAWRSQSRSRMLTWLGGFCLTASAALFVWQLVSR